MSRHWLMLGGMVVVAGSIIAFSLVGTHQPLAAPVTVAPVAITPASPVAALHPQSPPVPTPAPTPAQVKQWSTQAAGDDPNARVDAITSLGEAPRSEALPALAKVLESGSPEDQQRALDALGNLAVTQGDPDGAVQEILRRKIYHGDGGDTTQHAQSTLDDVQQTLPAANNQQN